MWKHLSKGPSRSCCCCWKALLPNKAISQSPRHPAPPLPASVFPPFQTSDHSSLCLPSPDGSRPDRAHRNAPAGAQPITAFSQSSSAQGRAVQGGGLRGTFPSPHFCPELLVKKWPAFIYFSLWPWPFPITQRRDLLVFCSWGQGVNSKIILILGTPLPKKKEY